MTILIIYCLNMIGKGINFYIIKAVSILNELTTFFKHLVIYV